MWCRFGERKAGIRAHKMLRIMGNGSRFHVHDRYRTLSEVQRRHHGILDALFVLLRRFQAVDDQFDEMGLVSVERCKFVEFADLAVDAHLGVSSLSHLLDEFLVMALASLYQRGKEVALAVAIVLHYQGDDLFVGISDHRLAGFRRICSRSTGVEQTQEIVDFGYGTHGRARVVSGRLLLDCDDRAEACDGLDFRLLEYAHEMLRICRQRVHVPALTFRVDGIEREGRLSAAAESCHYDKTVTRDIQ